MLICFFVSNPLSAYYSSDVLEGVMRKLALPFEFKQVEGKLKLVARGVDTLEKARALLGKLK
jgi:hypothetical protein